MGMVRADEVFFQFVPDKTPRKSGTEPTEAPR
jgi:hypothetical protein